MVLLVVLVEEGVVLHGMHWEQVAGVDLDLVWTPGAALAIQLLTILENVQDGLDAEDVSDVVLMLEEAKMIWTHDHQEEDPVLAFGLHEQ